MGGVPKSLPALVKATRIQDKAAGVGFDWDNIDDVFAKIKEEIDELHAEVKAQKQSNIESELERTNRKFIARFQYLEEKATAQGKSLKDMTLQEMETYWQEAKNL